MTRFRHSKTLSVLIAVSLVVVAENAQGQPRVDPFRADAPRNAAPGGGVINSAELVDTPVTSIFKMVSDLTGWTIVMSPEVSKAPPKVNIWIKNMSPEQVLERLGTIAGLVVERKGTVVEVLTFDEFAKLRGAEKQVIQLKNARAREVAANLQPFLVKDQARVVADEEGNKIILLMAQPLLGSLIRLVESLDAPFEKDDVKLIRLRHLDAATLVPKLERFLSDPVRSGGRGSVTRTDAGSASAANATTTVQASESTRAGDRWLVQFMIEAQLNALVLRGLARDVAQTEDLVRQLDVPPDLSVASYPLRYTNAREVNETLQALLAETLKPIARDGADRDARRLRISMSEQNNQLIVEGSARDHERITSLLSAIDQPLPPSSGGIRVYRLENSTAKHVTEVLLDLIEERGRRAPRAVQERRVGSQQGVERAVPVAGAGEAASQARPAGPEPAAAAQSPGTSGPDNPSATAADVVPAQVTAADEVNAVIIKASAAEHEEFAKLIRELDQPRDQVMLEVTLVTVRSTRGFDLGVELSGASLGNSGVNALGFSTFGVGRANPRTGGLRISNPPPFGLNVGLFKSDDFSMVINALNTVGDTRISSTPRILVEDNAPAELKQLNREPFATTSQGDATTVTSFGGFAEAGTTLTVVPHLSREEWLRLEYQVNLSSFDQRTPQQLAANLPPPVRQNTGQGTVRVPANFIVVLGGLTAAREENIKQGIPILSDIPLVGALFANQSKSRSNETLFIFIKPVILRDLNFTDLRVLSQEDLRHARLSRTQFPQNDLKLLVPGDAAEEDRP